MLMPSDEEFRELAQKAIESHDDGWHVCLHTIEVAVPVILAYRDPERVAGEFGIGHHPDGQPYTRSRVIGPFPDGVFERQVARIDLFPPHGELATPWISVVLVPAPVYESEQAFSADQAVWLAGGWNWNVASRTRSGIEEIDTKEPTTDLVPTLSFLLPDYVT